VDNAPIESWFSALKTESIYLYDQLSEDEMIALLDQYVKYYNEERLQEKIKELAPMDYRKQALSTLFNTCPFLTN
jgi:putative transposase